MATVKAHIGIEGYITHLHTDANEVIADEPVANGGEDKGFSPSELLASSLAACTCITVRMYANRKQWPLESLDVQVDFAYNDITNSSDFTRHITLNGNLTEEQRVRLLDIANKCPIHKVLTHPIHINTHLV